MDKKKGINFTKLNIDIFTFIHFFNIDIVNYSVIVDIS